MEEILFVNKSESQSYSLSDVIDTFKSTDNMDIIKNLVEKAEDRLYVSWASVDAVDNAGEKIPIEDVIKQQDILMKRGGAISNEHTNAIVGKTLAYKVMIHPITKTLGVLHLNQIYNDNLRDNQVWADIVNKKKTGSSVGGVHNVKESYSTLDADSGSFVKVLSGFGQYETAVTEKPCNKYATIEANSVIAKSDKKMGKEEVKKEDNMVVSDAPAAPETPVATEDNFKAEVMALIEKIGERLDAIEEKISGGASEEVAAEVQEADEPAKEEPAAEEPAKEEDDMAKSLAGIKKELEDSKKEIASLKKSIVKDTIKTDRPDQPKAEKEDVMKNIDNKIEDMKKSGKINFAEVGAEIRKAQEKELQAKFAQ